MKSGEISRLPIETARGRRRTSGATCNSSIPAAYRTRPVHGSARIGYDRGGRCPYTRRVEPPRRQGRQVANREDEILATIILCSYYLDVLGGCITLRRNDATTGLVRGDRWVRLIASVIGASGDDISHIGAIICRPRLRADLGADGRARERRRGGADVGLGAGTAHRGAHRAIPRRAGRHAARPVLRQEPDGTDQPAGERRPTPSSSRTACWRPKCSPAMSNSATRPSSAHLRRRSMSRAISTTRPGRPMPPSTRSATRPRSPPGHRSPRR